MKTLITVLTALVLFVGCGSPSDSSRAGGSGGGSEPVPGTSPSNPDSPIDDGPYDRDCTPGPMADAGEDPEEPVVHQACPDKPQPGKPKFEVVAPHGGDVVDVRPVPWERAMRGENDRTYRLIYWSGVEPCNVLDRVEVKETKSRVVATIYEGAAADQRNAACIEIALQKAVDITLDEPLGNRKLTDGAPNN